MKAATPINAQTTALGVAQRAVIVLSVVPEKGIAIVRDAQQITTEVNYLPQGGVGRIPRVGDYWLVDRALGPWAFSMYLAKDDLDLRTFSADMVFGAVLVNGQATLTDGLTIVKPGAADEALKTEVSGEAFQRFTLQADGRQAWGPGGSAQDVNLYRGGANLLKTDDLFEAANIPSGAWTSYTPTWTTSTGLHTPSIGADGTWNCAWSRVGRTIFVRFEVIFGSTTNFNGGTGSDNWRFGLPVQSAGNFGGIGYADLLQSNVARCMARVRLTTSVAFELEVSSGRVDAVAITNNGVADAISPWTWASGNAIRAAFHYEALASS